MLLLNNWLSYFISPRHSVPKQLWLVLIFMRRVIFNKYRIYQNQVSTLRLMTRCFTNTLLFSQSTALRRNTVRSSEQDVLVRNIMKTNLLWKLQTNLCAEILYGNLFIHTENTFCIFIEHKQNSLNYHSHVIVLFLKGFWLEFSATH